MNYHTVWGAKSKQKTQNHLAIYVRSENSKHKRMYHIVMKPFFSKLSSFFAIWRKEVHILQKTCGDVSSNSKIENNYIIMCKKVNWH